MTRHYSRADSGFHATIVSLSATAIVVIVTAENGKGERMLAWWRATSTQLGQVTTVALNQMRFFMFGLRGTF